MVLGVLASPIPLLGVPLGVPSLSAPSFHLLLMCSFVHPLSCDTPPLSSHISHKLLSVTQFPSNSTAPSFLPLGLISFFFSQSIPPLLARPCRLTFTVSGQHLASWLCVCVQVCGRPGVCRSGFLSFWMCQLLTDNKSLDSLQVWRLIRDTDPLLSLGPFLVPPWVPKKTNGHMLGNCHLLIQSATFQTVQQM